MGCTASTAVQQQQEESRRARLTPTQVRLRQKWRHVSETTSQHRQMNFWAVGNGTAGWVESMTNGLLSQTTTASSRQGLEGGQENQPISFRWDKVEYRIHQVPSNVALYNDELVAQDCDALVFCVSLAGYDQALTASHGITTNQMEAALEQFDYLCNHHKEFRTKDVIIYFTDVDEFEQKLKTSPVAEQDAFRRCQGGEDLQEALFFFGDLFRRRMGSRNSRGLFMHLAKNPESSVLSFVDTTKTIILTSGLVHSGFLKVDGLDEDDDDDEFTLSGMDLSDRTGTTTTDTSQVPSFVSF